MFSFEKYTKKEEKAIAGKKKDIEAASKEAADALRECIESNTFKKYKLELDKSGNALIQTGIDILKSIREPNERLALYDALFVRADVLSLLLKSVNKDNL